MSTSSRKSAAACHAFQGQEESLVTVATVPSSVTRSHSVPRAARNGLQILHEIFRLGYHPDYSPQLSDAVLVAIDCENTEDMKSGFAQREDCQVGLAILDTKEINRMPPDELISTLNFATGSPSYQRRASGKFMFGETIAASPSNIVSHIKSSIPPARNVVFVGHAIHNDLHALQGLDFEYPVLLSSVLDTFKIANKVFGYWGGSLGDLLLRLGCSFNRLHSAGNDANFTLRALLLLAADGFPNQQGEQEDDHDTLTFLRQISASPLPYWVDPDVLAMQKRDMRREKSRKHQPKTWSKEKQKEIRAARQLKKIQNITEAGEAVPPAWFLSGLDD